MKKDNKNYINERNQINIFDYNNNVPNTPLTNLSNLDRPSASRRGDIEANDKLNSYTFNTFTNKSNPVIPHPLDKPNKEIKVNDNNTQKKSNSLDFSKRMFPTISSMPNPVLNNNNNNFNPIYDRLPTIDTFNHKTKN
jgi:hypothetical protein